MATHSSVLAWRSPWTEEPGRLQSMGCKELDTLSDWTCHLKTDYGKAAAAAKSLQSCPTLCDPIDGSPPWGSPGKNTGVGCHFLLQRMKVKSEGEVSQWFSTLSDPMNCSLPGSSAHGIFQARVLEWVAIAFSNNMLYSRSIDLNINLIKNTFTSRIMFDQIIWAPGLAKLTYRISHHTQ